jgi:hypothetical protein
MVAQFARIGKVRHAPAVDVVLGQAFLGEALEAIGVAGGLRCSSFSLLRDPDRPRLARNSDDAETTQLMGIDKSSHLEALYSGRRPPRRFAEHADLMKFHQAFICAPPPSART